MLTYIASLFFVGYYENHDTTGTPGFLLVLFGVFFLFSHGGAALIWIANPILWYSWAPRRKPKYSFYSSLISMFIALSFMFFNKGEF